MIGKAVPIALTIDAIDTSSGPMPRHNVTANSPSTATLAKWRRSKISSVSCCSVDNKWPKTGCDPVVALLFRAYAPTLVAPTPFTALLPETPDLRLQPIRVADRQAQRFRKRRSGAASVVIVQHPFGEARDVGNAGHDVRRSAAAGVCTICERKR